ncbi:site-specific integrase [Caryophanon tenue]|uniref:Uncharacterized protein n=1 Tax=Caryophanon tenue TaxID=33978 RepID=A0A1C0YER1_9BACL|nr:site-specific integrase [Caryophanon tenue]OCS85658.1 hypothetical protein A6M13_03075 [Caryophanon tenue]
MSQIKNDKFVPSLEILRKLAIALDYDIYTLSLNAGIYSEENLTILAKHVDPTEDEEELNFYTKEELLHFLKCMEEENNFKAYTLFRILAFSGMRKGEALALTWEDINFKDCEIRINKALSRGKDNRLYVKTTKTKSSRRTLKMD